MIFYSKTYHLKRIMSHRKNRRFFSNVITHSNIVFMHMYHVLLRLWRACLSSCTSCRARTTIQVSQRATNDAIINITLPEPRTQPRTNRVRNGPRLQSGRVMHRSSRASQCTSVDGDINPLPSFNVRFARTLRR